MADSQTIAVNNELDIIEARMRVRTLAREAGLDLFDQARISLATSTLAIILGLEKGAQGWVTMKQLSGSERVGVQVICSRHDVSLHDLAGGVMDDARRMVDELQVNESPEGGIAVTLLKWAGRSRKRETLDHPPQAATGGGD